MKTILIFILVSIIYCCPITLHSGVSYEVDFMCLDNFPFVDGSVYRDSCNDAYIEFPCIQEMLIANYYFYQYLDCLSNPECANDFFQLLNIMNLWLYYEGKLLQCLDVI